jgi:hypothetical protein
MPAQKLSRLQLLNEFESAPNSSLFNQQTIAGVLSCSTQLLERNRWAGGGVPYLKIGRKVLYRKRCAEFSSTTKSLSQNQ